MQRKCDARRGTQKQVGLFTLLAQACRLYSVKGSSSRQGTTHS